jgi:hypothetical protein
MNETRDDSLSRLYGMTTKDEPPAVLDDRILAAARRATIAAPARRRSPWRAWLAPMGVAATVVLSLSVLLLARHEQPDLLPAPVVAPRPAEPATADAPAVAAPEPRQAAMPIVRRSPPPARSIAPAREEDRLQEQAIPAAKLQPPPPSAPAMAPPAAAAAPAAAPLQMEAAPAGAAPGVLSAPAAAKADRQRLDGGVRTAEVWLEDIRRLQRAGHLEAAREQLAAFRRAYPDYPLPDDVTE